jgi:hypothetical protein
MEMIGWDRMLIKDWKVHENIDDSSKIRLVRLSHIRYQHPDFNAISTFLQDFGMHLVKHTEDKLWWRGSSNQPYVYVVEKGEMKFLGGAFEVESFDDLERWQFQTFAPVDFTDSC